MFRCRACRSGDGEIVLDLGRQPSWDHMPPADQPLPDPKFPLCMWWCRECWLAQLLEDADEVTEVPGIEPRAMLDQTDLSIARMEEMGLLTPGATVLEFGSPHGESWLPRLAGRGVVPPASGAPADLVLDVYGLLHEPDQADALRRRAEALAPGGTLVLQLLSLATVLRHRQWFDLRHGHRGYWSVPALDRALHRHGVGVHRAWRYPLAGGTVLVAATRSPRPDPETLDLVADEVAVGVADPGLLRGLQDAAGSAAELREWLCAEGAAGRTVLGYGAASRAVPLVCHADLDATLLPAVADASPAKQGRRMPGTDIPIVSPAELVGRAPDRVLLFLPELATEVREALPRVERSGGRWVVLDPQPRVVEPVHAS
ncbi:class I SAM-dependent methyltransferase [Pseudonocardia nigra]|uniref:class I SAM-dependent methyltransferase n=1 Tax=Pseudonocardia nigra TaxID=1921578 RepID=UPI001C5FDD11|nr:class I SAM-dependent methyltransferase [Pseudonocardia nigra]